MKRVLSVMFVLIIAMGVAFATNPIIQEKTFSNADTSVNVTLNLTTLGETYNYLEVGFSTDAINKFSTTQETTATDSLSLTTIENGVAKNNYNSSEGTSDLYVYYKVRGNAALSISITADTKMSNGQQDESKKELAWTVKYKNTSEEIIVDSVGPSQVGTTTFYSKDSPTWITGDYGSFPISITTASIDSVPVDSYSGKLTVAVNVT